ncbi:MAG: hypothetical protein IKA80_03545 [Spirochaetaceae bacterium]|nr:hypothetical protein [Spirochaetaceae bacterium]
MVAGSIELLACSVQFRFICPMQVVPFSKSRQLGDDVLGIHQGELKIRLVMGKSKVLKNTGYVKIFRLIIMDFFLLIEEPCLVVFKQSLCLHFKIIDVLHNISPFGLCQHLVYVIGSYLLRQNWHKGKILSVWHDEIFARAAGPATGSISL